jgi:hypothetical protein
MGRLLLELAAFCTHPPLLSSLRRLAGTYQGDGSATACSESRAFKGPGLGDGEGAGGIRRPRP